MAISRFQRAGTSNTRKTGARLKWPSLTTTWVKPVPKGQAACQISRVNECVYPFGISMEYWKWPETRVASRFLSVRQRTGAARGPGCVTRSSTARPCGSFGPSPSAMACGQACCQQPGTRSVEGAAAHPGCATDGPAVLNRACLRYPASEGRSRKGHRHSRAWR